LDRKITRAAEKCRVRGLSGKFEDRLTGDNFKSGKEEEGSLVNEGSQQRGQESEGEAGGKG